MLFVVRKSDTYNLKIKGEIFEPRGTFALIYFVSDVVMFIRTLKRREDRQCLISLYIAVGTLRCEICVQTLCINTLKLPVNQVNEICVNLLYALFR